MCNKLCKKSEDTCKHCKGHYKVSSHFYKAKRSSVDGYVTGYLVKNMDGRVEGILNSANNFRELAFIDEKTLKFVKEVTPIYDFGFRIGEYDPSNIQI